MASRPRSPSSHGPGRGGGDRSRSRSVPKTRRTTRAGAELTAAQLASSRAKLTGRAAVLLLVLAVLAVSYASSMRAWLAQRSEINLLSEQIADQRADVAALKQAKQRWRDPAYIQTQARLRFGWLMPGETGYRVLGPDGQVLSDGGSELTDPTTPNADASSEWWEDQWRSVTEAGKDPAEAAAAPDKPERTPVDRIGPPRGDRRPHSAPPSDR